jgi:thiol-disulfide isomerase/thioredoxin
MAQLPNILKKHFFSIAVLGFMACAQSGESQVKQEKTTQANPSIHKEFSTLEPLFHQENDTVYVVNFWATWCKPCVKELPYFEELHNTLGSKKVKVLLVSLDFPDQIQSKLIPFLHDKQLKSDVHVLTDGDMNSWIPKVNKDWSGAIPATLVYNKKQRAFYEQSFDSLEDLTTILKPFLN